MVRVSSTSKQRVPFVRGLGGDVSRQTVPMAVPSCGRAGDGDELLSLSVIERSSCSCGHKGEFCSLHVDMCRCRVQAPPMLLCDEVCDLFDCLVGACAPYPLPTYSVLLSWSLQYVLNFS